MLNVQITKDKVKLAKQIEALELTLEEDNLTAGDKEIFTETLKILKEAKEGKQMKPIITNFTIVTSEEDKPFFGKNYTRLLQKANLTHDELIDLAVLKNLFKDWYAPNLIAKSFLLYRKNIAEICALEEEFRELKIITPFNRLHVQTLDELLKLMDLKNGIRAEAKKFYDDFYKDMKDDYCFGKILFRFKQSRKLGLVVTA